MALREFSIYLLLLLTGHNLSLTIHISPLLDVRSPVVHQHLGDAGRLLRGARLIVSDQAMRIAQARSQRTPSLLGADSRRIRAQLLVAYRVSFGLPTRHPRSLDMPVGCRLGVRWILTTLCVAVI